MKSRIRVKGKLRPITRILTEKGISLREICVGDGYVDFSTAGKDTYLASEELKKSGKDFTVLKDGRVKSYLLKNALRFGIYVGLIFGIIAAVFYSRSVTRVDISGNKLIEKEEIMSVITEGLSFPTDKSSVDVKKIEKSVIGMDGVFSASAEIKGNTLIVKIYEEPEKPDIVDKTDFTDVKSDYDGVITRINVYSGQAAVKRGDTVKKGQTLISCDKVSPDGVEYKENALGEIYARVWVTKEKLFYPTIITTRRTGKSEKRVTFFAPPKRYEGKFSSCETVVTEKYLPGIFPVKYYVTEYYETEETEKEFDFYAEEENIVKEETVCGERDLPHEGELIRTWYEIKRLDKNVNLVIYYELEIRIN